MFRRRRRRKHKSILRANRQRVNYLYTTRRKPHAKRGNREFDPKPYIRFGTWVFGILLVCFTIPKVYANPFKKVKIVDGYGEYTLLTKADTVREIYTSGVLNMKESDSTIDLDTAVVNDMTIYVDRSIVVNVISGGTNVKIRTQPGTAREILTKAGISFEESDAFNMSLDDVVANGDTLVHELIETKTVTKRVTIEFDTVEVEDSTLLKGKTDVINSGENGYKNVSYLITYQNGVEISRVQSGEKIIKEPVSRKVAIGTREQTAVAASTGSSSTSSAGSSSSSSSSVIRPTKPVVVVDSVKDLDPTRIKSTKVVGVTAYTHTGNATATGVMPARGTVAVDPKQIPLGTKLYIPGYGFGVAQDTGRMAPNTIDLFMDTYDECISWGRQTKTIYILKW